MAGINATPNAILPPRIGVSRFTAARFKEIKAMRKSISESSGTKMVFQKLPKHMRRRAMSHVVKRLPRRLREIHINQMKKSGLPPKNKRPTRKFRRRPANLQSDYARRRRRIKWLDTHIWHAKRFHMIEKWGFKLPKQPCDKSFRACYRATTQHSLVQDLSYNRCLEISGLYDEIILQLIKITDPRIGLTFGAKCFHEGKKFGKLLIFEPISSENNSRKAVGEVEFFWNHKTTTENRILWLFVHPAYYKQVLDILIDLYKLNPLSMKENEKISSYSGSQSIILRELEYELGKFRLTGPLSTAVLKHALRLVDLNEKPDELPPWLKNYSSEALLMQNRVVKDMTDTSYLPPNTVFSVIVYDPRLNLPKKRTKALLTVSSYYDDFDSLQNNLSLSPLFEESVRNLVNSSKVPNSHISELRSKFLVPGSELPLEGQSIIPIILLWRPGNVHEINNGYASGWDVIVPSNWSQSFFLSFVMWGARAGGLRETESIAFERGQIDTLSPDTTAGELEENYIRETCREKYFRLPPNKRTNYNKFGIVSPFSFNWKMLIADWSGRNCDSISVLRDKKLLKNIQEFLTSKSKFIPSLPPNCLVPVNVTPVNKGKCSAFGIICIPGQGDIEAEPVEANHKDPSAQKRKQLRHEHKNLLQKLRRRRKRASRMGKPITPTDAALLSKYKNEMRRLWLPEATSIRSSCSRPIIGFIKHGDFSFTLGQSKGFGYVVADSLNDIASSSHRDKVLIRNTSSKQYKLAVLRIVVE